MLLNKLLFVRDRCSCYISWEVLSSQSLGSTCYAHICTSIHHITHQVMHMAIALLLFDGLHHFHFDVYKKRMELGVQRIQLRSCLKLLFWRS